MTEGQEFVKLSWKLLEAKCAYYIYCDPIMEDHEYDSLERRYDFLSKKLNLAPTAADMVGFDTERPSCKLVLTRMIGKGV